MCGQVAAIYFRKEDGFKNLLRLQSDPSFCYLEPLSIWAETEEGHPKKYHILVLNWLAFGTAHDHGYILYELARGTLMPIEFKADDYVVKPFDARDLLARVRAVLRRARWSSAPGPGEEIEPRNVAHFAGWQLNLKRMQLISPQGDEINLTAGEFNLLSVLIGHSGQVHSRDQLIDLTYGREMFPFERTIDTLISRLRRKIEKDHRSPNLIKTIRGAGYVFTPEVEWP